MNSEKKLIDNKVLFGAAILVPILFIIIVIVGRHMVIPTNEEVLDELKNTKYYSAEVNYKFMNSKNDFKETTKQYYSYDKGMRIEFQEGSGSRVKVYKGSEIKVEENDDEFTLDKDIDVIYPLAFLENIFSNPTEGQIDTVKSEWGDSEFLKVTFKYNYQNKHLDRAELYVDKNTKSPVILKIYDDEGNERIIITYENFQKEKQLSDDLF